MAHGEAPKGRGCLAAFLGLFDSPQQESPRLAGADSYEVLPAVLTPGRLAFFEVLQQALPEGYAVFAEVSLAAIFEVRRGRPWKSAHNRINQKRVDFVVYERATTRPICGIELDDVSHGRADRQDRDLFVDEVFKACRLPLIRVRAARSYSVADVKARLASVIRPA
jgi:hypothetical protein